MGALLGLILPLIPGLITLAEKAFTAKTGPAKADAVITSVASIVQQLQKSGAIPAGLDVAQIATAVETVFQQMNAAGQVNTGTQPLPFPASGQARGGDFILTFKQGLMQSVG